MLRFKHEMRTYDEGIPVGRLEFKGSFVGVLTREIGEPPFLNVGVGIEVPGKEKLGFARLANGCRRVQKRGERQQNG